MTKTDAEIAAKLYGNSLTKPVTPKIHRKVHQQPTTHSKAPQKGTQAQPGGRK
jgi:hypothetical protein